MPRAYRSARGEIEKGARIHRFRGARRRLEGVDPPDARHLRLGPLLLPVAQAGRLQGRLERFEQVPAAEGGGGAAVVLGHLARAAVRVLDALSVAGAAERLGAEGKRDRGADVVDHFLRDHLGVHDAPVPLVFERLAEPGDAVEDDGLHFDAGGAVGVPDGLDPEVEVEILAVFVDVGVAGDGCGWEVEVIGRGPHPFFRQRVGPSRDEKVDGYGVFEDIVDFFFRVWASREV